MIPPTVFTLIWLMVPRTGERTAVRSRRSIKATLVASASGMPPSLAVEFGRKVLYPKHRPSFAELEQAVRGR